MALRKLTPEVKAMVRGWLSARSDTEIERIKNDLANDAVQGVVDEICGNDGRATLEIATIMMEVVDEIEAERRDRNGRRA